MTHLRIGTRGSDLARTQTRIVVDRLRAIEPSLTFDEVVIKTSGDAASEQNRDPSTVGAFVGALEHALLDERIDLAVHSCKDLQTTETAGLVIAATPTRAAVHDVLLMRRDVQLEDLAPGARIGTASPRRTAQLRRAGDFEIVPVRGNVPTRIEKLEREQLDGVVLAAAGLTRLGIEHPHTVPLPTHRFVPAPGQGALAVQARVGSAASAIAADLDDRPTRTAVTAERALLHEVGAGCHAPVGALATVDGPIVTLLGQVFSEDHARQATATASGSEAEALGIALARRLLAELGPS